MIEGIGVLVAVFVAGAVSFCSTSANCCGVLVAEGRGVLVGGRVEVAVSFGFVVGIVVGVGVSETATATAGVAGVGISLRAVSLKTFPRPNSAIAATAITPKIIKAARSGRDNCLDSIK